MLSNTSSPPTSRRFEGLSDPYSPVIVDDLLSGLSDWRNIQDIIRLTFKAMADVVKAQGTAIRDIERQLPQKLGKAEANAALGQKANATDLSHHVAELQTLIESRGPVMDFQTQLEQKVSRSDLSYLLGSRPTIEEVKTILEAKASTRELEGITQTLIGKIEEQGRELLRRLSSCAADRDLRLLEAKVQEKANLTDMEEALNDKAGKQMVSSALSRKANVSDVEVLVSRKADVSELQNLIQAMDSKVNVTWVEQVNAQLQSKAENADFGNLSEELVVKASKRDLDELHESLVLEIRDLQKQFSAQISSVDDQANGLTSELERVRTTLTNAVSRKVENKDVDKLLTMIGKKADEDRVNDLLRIHKTELSDFLGSINAENRAERSVLEQKIIEKSSKLEQDFRELVSESMKLRTQVADIQDGHRREQDEQAKYTKSLNSSLKLEFSNELFSLKDQVEALIKGVSAMSKEKAAFADLMEVKTQVMNVLSAKAGVDQVEETVSGTKGEVTNMLQTLRDDFKTRLTRLESDVFAGLDKKSSASETQAYLAEKADSGFVARLCSLKARVM